MAWVEGVDVSHWQTPGEKYAVGIAATGARYVWVKTSQGSRSKDDARFDHHKHFGTAGLLRGGYHYYDFNATPEANAANFLAALAGRTWELPPVLDAEHGTAGSKKATADVLLRFLSLMQQGTNKVPVVYTYASWWNDSVEPREDFKRYPLWVARYPSRYDDGNPPPADASTPTAKPWPGWAVWQFSTTGGRLDRNVCTPAAFAALTGNTEPKGWLMALTDKQQQDLYDWVKDLHADYGTEGKGVRQVIAEIDNRTVEIVKDTRELTGKDG